MRIVFYLKNLFKFWFCIEQIGADQYDIRLTIAHEIIHGLGFGVSSLIEWNIQRNDLGKAFLAKRPVKQIVENCFYRTYVFTHNLVGIFEEVYFRFPDLINRIVIDSKDRNWKEYNDRIGASEDALNAGSLLHRISESTMFLVKSEKLIFLDGMSHISKYYGENSRDFLMYAQGTIGVTVESRLEEFNMQSIIGPNIKEIMETIGWRFDKQEYDKITIDKR